MKKVVICGAAGRDFHNFNTLYRQDPDVQVVGFTAAQLPNIDRRRYPPALAGPSYPDGIPIYPQSELLNLCRRKGVDEVLFSYSDVDHQTVMALAEKVLHAGPSFRFESFSRTRLRARIPVLSVCAVRTGCGKSQIARYLGAAYRDAGYRVALMRHPMPYGHLAEQKVQKFSSLNDLKRANCTIEEREEYERHILAGATVYAGVDYAEILSLAEQENDAIIWDGGNNDGSFLHSDFHIVVVDALRPDELCSHYPGLSVLLEADLVVVNKCDSATEAQIEQIKANLTKVGPEVPQIEARSKISSQPEQFEGRVLVLEDGPTTTHGGLSCGAGYIVAQRQSNVEVVDPRPFAVGTLQDTYRNYPHIGPVLPAMGYGQRQIDELSKTIAAADVDWIVCGSPIDLTRVLDSETPVVQVSYEYEDMGPRRLLDYVRKGFVDAIR